MRIVSGIQPTGPLHLGNYLGAIKHCLELQKNKENECFFFVADYHSLTEGFEPKEKYEQIFELCVELLALGLDPKKSVLFIQSHAPQVTELAWIFNCITPVSFLERMTQYKDKAQRQAQNINVGLLTYPVLQAADILIYRGEGVPVGLDQIQHIELACDIVKFFNNRFGEYFKKPKFLLTPTPKVMSLLEPEKKMSKSLGADHCIFLSDSPAEMERKIKKSVTDIGPSYRASSTIRGARSTIGEMSPGVSNLFLLLENFGKKEDIKKFNADYQADKIKYSELKGVLTKRIADYFEEFRKKKESLFKNPKEIMEIYSKGNQKARQIASETLNEVFTRLGLSTGLLDKS